MLTLRACSPEIILYTKVEPSQPVQYGMLVEQCPKSFTMPVVSMSLTLTSLPLLSTKPQLQERVEPVRTLHEDEELLEKRCSFLGVSGNAPNLLARQLTITNNLENKFSLS